MPAAASTPPSRPSGISADIFGYAPAEAERSPPILPGARQFTVTLRSANSTASALVRPPMPALAADTSARFLAPMWAEPPPMFTIVPPPPAPITRRTARHSRKAQSQQKAQTQRHTPELLTGDGPRRPPSALFTRMSTA